MSIPRRRSGAMAWALVAVLVAGCGSGSASRRVAAGSPSTTSPPPGPVTSVTTVPSTTAAPVTSTTRATVVKPGPSTTTTAGPRTTTTMTAATGRPFPTPSVMPPGTPAPAPPADWKKYEYASASVWVPPDWAVFGPNSGTCTPGGRPTLYLGPRPAGLFCGPNGQAPPPDAPVSVRVVPYPSAAPAGVAAPLGGFDAVASPITGPSGTEYAVAQLAVAVDVRGDAAMAVASTLRASNRAIVLSDDPVATPADTKPITFDGISLNVPSAWPVHTLAPSDQAPSACWGYFTTPAAFLARGSTAEPSCPYIPFPPARDGVWVLPSAHTDGLPTGTMSLHGLQAAVLDLPNQNLTVRLWVDAGPANGLQEIVLGIGDDPGVAKGVLQSIRPAGR